MILRSWLEVKQDFSPGVVYNQALIMTSQSSQSGTNLPHFGPKPRFWHRWVQKIAASSFGSWLLADNLHRLDRPFLRWSGGRLTLTGILAGLPVVVLTTTGAKSGQPRTLPLAALQDGDRLVLVASAFGKPHHPGWYHNLKANPDAQVQIDGIAYTCRAFEAQGDERSRYWRQAVEMYPGFSRYEEKAKPRRIPLMVLEIGAPLEEKA
jgi:deazaflavin-dependent oxidoreductase (nitroreductase family)